MIYIYLIDKNLSKLIDNKNKDFRHFWPKKQHDRSEHLSNV